MAQGLSLAKEKTAPVAGGRSEPDPASLPSGEAVLTELRKAAYFTLYSMPNPEHPNVPVFSLEHPLIVQVGVNEQLHRFPIDPAAGTRIGEPAATVAMHWTPMPEGFAPTPGEPPPPTPLDPTRGQPFATLNGALTFNGGSLMHGFGHGRTYSQQAGGNAQLYLGAAVNAMSTEGGLAGHEGCVLVNGHITPPTGLSLAIVGRFQDPDQKLVANRFAPLRLFPNPDPAYATLMVLAEPDAAKPGKVRRGENGEVTGWNWTASLRLVEIDWDASEQSGIHSRTTVGALVGSYKSEFRFDPRSPSDTYVSYPATTEGGVLEFHDLDGHPIGSLKADITVGDVFPSSLNVGSAETFRVAALGPVVDATGAFEGAQGMMTCNGALALDPLVGSVLHIFRLYDPQGTIRGALKQSWKLRKPYRGSTLTAQDQRLLTYVEDSLKEGLEIKRWWERTDARDSFAERFALMRGSNPADRAYGFFDNVPLQEGKAAMMGLCQEMPFDSPRDRLRQLAENQIRDYVLHYFLRSTEFAAPAAAGGRQFAQPSEALTRLFSRNAPPGDARGFGYSQLYYKTVTGQIGAFDEADRYSIIDLRELGRTFQWVVLKVDLFNFVVPFKPFGEQLPQLAIPLREETYVVMSPEFVVNRPGEYGLGYALLRVPDDGTGVLAYGPGKFLNGFQTIVFSVGPQGRSHVKMAFAANRPAKIMNIPYDPMGMAYRLANTLTLGQAARVTDAFSAFLPSFLTPTGVDPMQASIAFANAMTGGAAAEHLGISVELAEKFMLAQHFMQHYQMITGALSTYRQVPDWGAGAGIPMWIRTGRRLD